MSNYLIVPDLHLPMEKEGALKDCIEVKKEYKIPNENVYFTGDELDQYFASHFSKSPDAPYSAVQELQIAKDKLKAWYKVFPQARIANSNHQMRWFKRFLEAEIPTQFMKDYKAIIEAPTTWHWSDNWIVKAKHPFIIQHGTGYSGKDAARSAAMNNGMSTVIGHVHSFAGTSFIRTVGLNIWAFNVGCLIDVESFAFSYAKEDKFKATIGVGVVLDDGRYPLWIPL